MTVERLPHANHGVRLAEYILSNKKVLDGLIAGDKVKSQILQAVISRLGNHSESQASFFKTLFRNLAMEGPIEITNKRDTAKEILTNGSDIDIRLNKAITHLIKANQTVVYDEYIRAAQLQTKNNSPLTGSIYTLLEVGKAIAPYLPSEPQSKQKIINELRILAKKFDTSDKRLHIESENREIKKRMSDNWLLDDEVRNLIEKGHKKHQIAELLDKNVLHIRNSIRRLIRAGIIKPAVTTPEDLANRDEEIEKLKKEGLTNPEVAKRRGESIQKVNRSVHRLRADKKIGPPPKGNPVSRAVTELDALVEKLRKLEFSNSEIAELIGRANQDIRHSAHRLIKAERIDSRKGKPIPIIIYIRPE